MPADYESLNPASWQIAPYKAEASETLTRMLDKSVRLFADRNALGHKTNGEYTYITYRELGGIVRALATSLHAMGVRRGDTVAILAENSVNWVYADLATLMLGAISVPIYPTLPAGQVGYILHNAQAKVVFASDASQEEKVAAIRSGVPSLDRVITFAESASTDAVPLNHVLDEGRAKPLTDGEYEALWQAVEHEDLASIIYTSGTTGEPKGVELTHRNFVYINYAAMRLLDWNETDIYLTALPLAHIYTRCTSYYIPLAVGACNVFMESFARLAQNFSEIRPTIFMGMPRIYEMTREKIVEGVRKMGPLKYRMFMAALAAGRKAAESINHGLQPEGLAARIAAAADHKVFAQVRERFGGRIRYMFSAGAALDGDTLMFFRGLGLMLIEGYGLSETCSLLACNRPGRMRPNSVGMVSPGSELRIDDDGEVLCKGPGVMRGYHNNPQANAEIFTEDGWMRTGDVGSITSEGYLVITDRKKDILVLNNGKKVAPQKIEAMIGASHYVRDIILVGDGAQAVAAMIVPDYERLHADHKTPTDPETAAQDKGVRKVIKSEIERHSSGLAEFEKIRRFALLPHPFSIEGGELTPTLKVRRHILVRKYSNLVADLTKT
ncbi:MAG: long-chain fatty acid--CoA ligase [Armatimonadetes bacterium]|nr:long-chain fatty acid--CoA ligase [Armatimonadota bacterium]